MAGERDKLHVQSIGGRTVSKGPSFVDLRCFSFFIIYQYVVSISAEEKYLEALCCSLFLLETDYDQQSLTTKSGAMCLTTISMTCLTSYL